MLADAGGAYVGSAETGAGGVYAISNLPDGRYTLTVMHLKYRTVEAVVDVVEGGTTQVGTLEMAFAGEKEGSDLNGDGVTDAGDLAVLAEQWLAAGDVAANFDQQGAVDLADLARMADLWRWEAMWTLTGTLAGTEPAGGRIIDSYGNEKRTSAALFIIEEKTA